jgi:organic hydroperoxide reductase OsmC/OhrA
VATKRKLALGGARVKVKARFSERGSVLQGTREAGCEGFEIEIALDSQEPAGKIAELLRLAHRMCFTEAALAGEVPLATRHFLNGRPLPPPAAADGGGAPPP